MFIETERAFLMNLMVPNPEFVNRPRRKAKGLGPDPQIMVRMPVELIAIIKEEAARRGVKPPVLIREGVVRLLAQSEATQHFKTEVEA